MRKGTVQPGKTGNATDELSFSITGNYLQNIEGKHGLKGTVSGEERAAEMNPNLYFQRILQEPVVMTPRWVLKQFIPDTDEKAWATQTLAFQKYRTEQGADCTQNQRENTCSFENLESRLFPRSCMNFKTKSVASCTGVQSFDIVTWCCHLRMCWAVF